MQSPDDLPAKTLRKKPKPNNKTKTLSNKRPGEDFKSRACLSRKFACSERNQKPIKIKFDAENELPPERNAIKSTEVESNMSAGNNFKETKTQEKVLANREIKKQVQRNSNAHMIENSNIDGNKKPESASKGSNKIEFSNVNQNSVLKNEAPVKGEVSSDKSREQVMAERQAKKLAKQLKKGGKCDAVEEAKTTAINIIENDNITQSKKIDKSREEILAEREAKRLAKQVRNCNKERTSNALQTAESEQKGIDASVAKEKLVTIPEKKPTLSKAERRATQEAQRAAKAKLLEEKQKKVLDKTSEIPKKSSDDLKQSVNNVSNQENEQRKSPSKFRFFASEYKVKLFKHLDREDLQEKNHFINHQFIHPAIVQLGEQISTRTVVGSNARCISFLKALKILIQDYQTPPKKEFTRGLEESINKCVQYLDKCRPLAVSVSNAHKAIQLVLRHLSNSLPESELKEHLREHIDSYIRDQIDKAAQAISGFVQEKISEGDVILTYSCSSLIYQILEDAHNRKIDFRVIVVDSRPFLEGRELFRKLISKEIPCTYVLINAVGFIMPEVTKILLGAHALLANGNVMARTGTAQISLVAKSFNVPVLVCCETHKFSERVQTDAIVYNELGNPDDLVMNDSCKLSNWRKGANKILPLNLNYDITPPELVSAVVTEVAILPCTSVPVILRLKPTELY